MSTEELIKIISEKIKYFGFEIPPKQKISEYLNEYSDYYPQMSIEKLCFNILKYDVNNNIFTLGEYELYNIYGNMFICSFESMKKSFNLEVKQDYCVLGLEQINNQMVWVFQEKINLVYKQLKNSVVFRYSGLPEYQLENPDFGYVRLCYYNVFLMADYNRPRVNISKNRILRRDNDDFVNLFSPLSQYNLIMKEYVLKNKTIKTENYSENEIDRVGLFFEINDLRYKEKIITANEILEQMKVENRIVDFVEILNSLEIFDFDHLGPNMEVILFALKDWVENSQNRRVINFKNCKICKSSEPCIIDGYPNHKTFYQYLIQVINEKNNSYDFAFYAPQEDKDFILNIIIEFFSFIKALHGYSLGGIIRLKSPVGREYLFIENRWKLLEDLYPFGIECY